MKKPSQREIAKNVGVSEAYLSRFLSGERGIPIQVFHKLQAYLTFTDFSLQTWVVLNKRGKRCSFRKS